MCSDQYTKVLARMCCAMCGRTRGNLTVVMVCGFTLRACSKSCVQLLQDEGCIDGPAF